MKRGWGDRRDVTVSRVETELSKGSAGRDRETPANRAAWDILALYAEGGKPA